jgi:ABC-type nitrate/sulfonate/bicarbonate transport system substrate-binding protein
MLEIEAEGDGRFHALVYFNEAFPGITANSQFARREMADKYPDMVKDLIRAVLNARRRLQEPQVLAEEIEKRFELEPVLARASADIYLEHELWDVNGRYTYELVQRNIEFLESTGTLEPGLKAEDIADLSFLNEVLDEIGRN